MTCRKALLRLACDDDEAPKMCPWGEINMSSAKLNVAFVLPMFTVLPALGSLRLVVPSADQSSLFD